MPGPLPNPKGKHEPTDDVPTGVFRVSRQKQSQARNVSRRLQGTPQRGRWKIVTWRQRQTDMHTFVAALARRRTLEHRPRSRGQTARTRGRLLPANLPCPCLATHAKQARKTVVGTRNKRSADFFLLQVADDNFEIVHDARRTGVGHEHAPKYCVSRTI